MDNKGFLSLILEFITNRVVIFCALAIFVFSFVVLKLFDIQIVNGEMYSRQIKTTQTKEPEIEAPRGAIYDKFGRPLAMNKAAYSVKIDGTVTFEDRNQSALHLIEILDANEEEIIDDLPITKTKPYQFLFDENKKREERWKLDMGMEGKDLEMNAEEAYEFLCKKAFKIPEGLPPDTERKLLIIRQSLALTRYNFKQATIASDVKYKTIAMLEEEKHKFPGVIIDVEPLRVYPEGALFSHIVGYIRAINDTQLEELKQKDDTYTENDIVGQLGVEKSMELSLKGKNGKKTIEADATGRVISSEISIPAIPGDKVFITIDAAFQAECYKILRNNLRDAIVNKLEGRVAHSITIKDFCINMVKINKKIVDAAYRSTEEKPELYKIRKVFFEAVPEYDSTDSEKIKAAKDLVAEAIENNEISPKTIALALFEMGMLKDSPEYIDSIRMGRKTPLSVFKEKLMSDELEPSDTGCDPCTGAISVTDVKTGASLALITYPSYDNNHFVNGFNMDYYNELMNDENFPLNNRPLMQKKAPGSTFKMVSATAVLQEGIVAPDTLVTDYGSFIKAGQPYAKCWIYSMGGTHGSVNVSKAIEVSCNYFFYETVFRLGNHLDGTTIQGITTLDRYMSYFGLTDLTGIEIEESMPTFASPDSKKELARLYNPNATEAELRWKDGDTIRAAIGQSDNSFTAANMSKYIATLANGGKRFKTFLIDKSEDFYGNNVTKTEPVLENDLQISEANLDAIFKGMYAVTAGVNGTSRAIFQSLPIGVAGKTGTAQEDLDRASHTWYVGFAPYEQPEISVAVMIPFGESVPSPSAVIARDVIGAYFEVDPAIDDNIYQSRVSK